MVWVSKLPLCHFETGQSAINFDTTRCIGSTVES